MATIANPAALRENYPPPPNFYKLYAPDDGTRPLPPLPPPVPTHEAIEDLRDAGKFLRVFGNDFKLDDELVPRMSTALLYQRRPDGSIDFKGEMRRLSGELMFMMMQLLAMLAESPGAYATPLTQVNQLFSNLVALTNALRPHQARATLEGTLRLHMEQLRGSVARVKAQVAAADKVMEGFAKALAECDEGGDTAASSAARPPAMAPLDEL